MSETMLEIADPLSYVTIIFHGSWSIAIIKPMGFVDNPSFIGRYVSSGDSKTDSKTLHNEPKK